MYVSHHPFACVGHDSLVCGTGIVCMEDMAYLHAGHDPCVCGT